MAEKKPTIREQLAIERQRNKELEAENMRLRQMLEHVHVNMKTYPHPKVIQQMIQKPIEDNEGPIA